MNREATGRRGASPTYSDWAIATFETLKSIYGLAGRQTEGLLHLLFDLMGVDYRCLSTAPSQGVRGN